MITETGQNLDVVILTQTAEDWRAFSCWYSVTKNLPDARVSMICHRNTKVEFQFYQWAKRLKIRHCYINPFCKEVIGDRLFDLNSSIQRGYSRTNGSTLLLDYTNVVVDVLYQDWLEILNRKESILLLSSGGAASIKMDKPKMDSIFNKYMFTGKFEGLPVMQENLFPEAKESNEPASIVSTMKGCGRWIDTMKGCPFSNADGLLSDDMTVNELRIFNLWRKMVALYSATN